MGARPVRENKLPRVGEVCSDIRLAPSDIRLWRVILLRSDIRLSASEKSQHNRCVDFFVYPPDTGVSGMKSF